MKKRCFLLFPNFLDKAVTLSYDDGVRQDIRLIDIMKKNKLILTFCNNISLESFLLLSYNHYPINFPGCPKAKPGIIYFII